MFEKYLPGSTSGGVLAKAHTRSTVDICTSSCVTVRTEPESERVTCVSKKHVKRDVFHSKETYINGKRLTKETYISQKRPISLT